MNNETTTYQINQLDSNAYFEVVANIKQQIKAAQYRAMLGANREMLLLYWNIGNTINEKAVWGNKFIENLAKEIKLEFPATTGYSIRNLKYMAKFANLFSNFEFVQRSVAQITWYHHIALMDKVDDMLKTETDNPSIGLLLCKENNKVIAKYALKDVEKPIGVSEYQLTKQLPKNIERVFPNIKDIENQLDKLKNV
jgi:predicted nuclease of restriction endonuclease-like (RecB) superfamily